MNKNDLVLSLASKYEFSKAYAQELVDFVLGSITSSVQKGEEVGACTGLAASRSPSAQPGRGATRRRARP